MSEKHLQCFKLSMQWFLLCALAVSDCNWQLSFFSDCFKTLHVHSPHIYHMFSLKPLPCAQLSALSVLRLSGAIPIAPFKFQLYDASRCFKVFVLMRRSVNPLRDTFRLTTGEVTIIPLMQLFEMSTAFRFGSHLRNHSHRRNRSYKTYR